MTDHHPSDPSRAATAENAGDPDRKTTAATPRPLSAAARRALAEAEERRRSLADPADRPKELNGREGPEPVRYGDWEKNGLISDF